ncbi:hypothetical protein MMC08_006543 [Hypocenomyce scalaris]|nr:hypothetical protein [Hypocenomyce scalaris]
MNTVTSTYSPDCGLSSSPVAATPSSSSNTLPTAFISPISTIINGTASTVGPQGQLPGDLQYTTTYTTVYSEFCPTGLQPKTYTVTATYSATPTPPNPTFVPPGFTATVTVCTVCGETPLTATLTVPCSARVNVPPRVGAIKATGPSAGGTATPRVSPEPTDIMESCSTCDESGAVKTLLMVPPSSNQPPSIGFAHSVVNQIPPGAAAIAGVTTSDLNPTAIAPPTQPLANGVGQLPPEAAGAAGINISEPNPTAMGPPTQPSANGLGQSPLEAANAAGSCLTCGGNSASTLDSTATSSPIQLLASNISPSTATQTSPPATTDTASPVSAGTAISPDVAIYTGAASALQKTVGLASVVGVFIIVCFWDFTVGFIAFLYFYIFGR